MINNDDDNCGIAPIDNFIDRQETINGLIDHLHTIIIDGRKERIIPIVCNTTPGIGRTETLLKTRELLTKNSLAKSYFDKETYQKYKAIRRRIGKVHMVEYQGERTIGYINSLPFTVHATNIVLVDNLPPQVYDRFDKHFIIVFFQSIPDASLTMPKDSGQIVLQPLTAENIAEIYRRKYARIISPNLLQKITSYSKGNLNKVHMILSSKDAVRDFENNVNFIFEVKAYMQAGDYIHARKLIEGMTASQNTMIAKHEEDYYTYCFICADLLHLENHYYEAQNALNQLRVQHLHNQERQIEIIEKMAHIKKHLGDFNGAIAELVYLPKDMQTAKSVSLYLLQYCLYPDPGYLAEAKTCLQHMSDEFPTYVTPVKDSLHTYQAVIYTYEHKYSMAHRSIDIAIDLYESLDSRFLNNCYFIKGEIFRHEKEFSKACEYYQRCLNAFRFNKDFDVYSLAYVMITYLNVVYSANHRFCESISLDAIKTRCVELGMQYNKALAMWLSELIMNLEDGNTASAKGIISILDSRVFFIP